MANAEKAAAVAELEKQFESSAGALLTEYRGLSVKQLKELRRSLGDNASYSVVKNRITKIAAKNAGIEGVEDLLTGPTAIAFVSGDAIAAAKDLRKFAKDNNALVIKGGVLDGATLTADEVNRLADLESREVLLSKVAGAMKGALSKAAGTFQAPLSKAARTTEALRAKVEQQGGASSE